MASRLECLEKAARYEAWAAETGNPTYRRSFLRLAELWRQQAAQRPADPDPADDGMFS